MARTALPLFVALSSAPVCPGLSSWALTYALHLNMDGTLAFFLPNHVCVVVSSAGLHFVVGLQGTEGLLGPEGPAHHFIDPRCGVITIPAPSERQLHDVIKQHLVDHVVPHLAALRNRIANPPPATGAPPLRAYHKDLLAQATATAPYLLDRLPPGMMVHRSPTGPPILHYAPISGADVIEVTAESSVPLEPGRSLFVWLVRRTNSSWPSGAATWVIANFVRDSPKADISLYWRWTEGMITLLSDSTDITLWNFSFLEERIHRFVAQNAASLKGTALRTFQKK